MVRSIFVQAPSQSVFTSSIPLNAQGFTTGAVFCSDGRFADQVDDFLHHGLALPGYDRLAVAGGPACFAGHLEIEAHFARIIDGSVRFEQVAV
ncbi:MAG: hypothetical protein JWN24_1152 [Phycisphaerales bacterium]|nr:hypothetical protein [Phycisphaerales bacterium]